ncbi:OsmC family protein [Angustibacter aerolatus]
MATVHRYRTTLSWSGSTAGGYRSYAREHDVELPPGTRLRVTADAPFGGDPAYPNPEQLLLAAAASCQLLSFLALAARAHVDVLEYADDAEAEMPVGRERMRITRIVLRPRVRVGDGTDRALVTRLLHEAHEECYVASSLTTEVVIEPEVTC